MHFGPFGRGHDDRDVGVKILLRYFYLNTHNQMPSIIYVRELLECNFKYVPPNLHSLHAYWSSIGTSSILYKLKDN